MTAKQNFIDGLKHGKAPDVAISFKKKDDGSRFPDEHSYRVTGWMKLVDPEVLKIEQRKLFKHDFLSDILIDSAQKEDGKIMMWCTREEATHVTGSGVCGCIVPIKDIICDGYVKWDKETIDNARESALRNVGEYVD